MLTPPHRWAQVSDTGEHFNAIHRNQAARRRRVSAVRTVNGMLRHGIENWWTPSLSCARPAAAKTTDHELRPPSSLSTVLRSPHRLAIRLRTRERAMGRLRAHIRRSVWVLMVALTAGCVSLPSFSPEDPEQSAAHDSGLTVTRAGYVEMMLENIVRTTSYERDGEIFAIVADYGGGYVTAAEVSGVGGTPSELLTFDTVIGATHIVDPMQGETYFGPSAIGCFRFTLSYYGDVSHHAIPCPAGSSPSAAAEAAQRQSTTAQNARSYDRFVDGKPLPLDLAAALQDGIGVPSLATASSEPRPSAAADAPLGPTDFAADNGVAALSVPQPGGACIYLHLTDAPVNNVSRRGVSVYGWAAPTRDPCTGQAALSEGGYVSADLYVGG